MGFLYVSFRCYATILIVDLDNNQDFDRSTNVICKNMHKLKMFLPVSFQGKISKRKTRPDLQITLKDTVRVSHSQGHELIAKDKSYKLII